MPVLASPLKLLPALAPLAMRVAGCPARVSLPFACRYAIPFGLSVPRARSGCPSGLRRVSVGYGCARAPVAFAPSPPPSGRCGARNARGSDAGRRWGRSRRFVPLRVSCRGPVLRLFGSWGGGPVPLSPRPAWGRALPCRQASCCVLALRAVGAACGRPGEAPLAWVWGVRGRALSHARPSVLWGVQPGPATNWPWVRGVRAWGPVNNPTARTLASWRCLLWGRHEGVWGGRLMPGCAASGIGRSPTLGRPFFGACGRGPLPTGCGCGGCGRGDPSPTPQRALLRAGLARCGGSRRAAGGGRPLPGCGASGVGRSPNYERLSFGACGRGPLPTGRGCGGCGPGDPSPIPQRALLRAGLAACGGGVRMPWGGISCLGVGRPGSGALTPPTARPLGRAAGACYPLAVGAGAAGVGTRLQPHSARSCELALRAVGAARGRPGGAPLA